MLICNNLYHILELNDEQVKKVQNMIFDFVIENNNHLGYEISEVDALVIFECEHSDVYGITKNLKEIRRFNNVSDV